MDARNVEREAELVLSAARLPTDSPSPITKVAASLLGPDSVRLVPPTALPSLAALARVGRRHLIFVRSGLSVEVTKFAVAHELSHYILKLGSEFPENEELCDRLAACLVAPHQAFASAVDRGLSLQSIARQFRLTEGCTVLRAGEVLQIPTALVSSASVRKRGGAFCWASDWELRAAPPGAGLERVELLDRSRFALRAVA
jgi:hypothetical protein